MLKCVDEGETDGPSRGRHRGGERPLDGLAGVRPSGGDFKENGWVPSS